MTRRMVRAAWAALGVCLIGGAIAGVLAWLGPPSQPLHRALQELSTLLDVAALMFWVAIFTLYWSKKQSRGRSI